jgi:sodium transport system permease protein
MNVALDATAGERERRSLVPLLLTAAPRRAVVLGKWAATVAFGLAGMLLTVAGCAAALAIGAGAGRTEPVPPGVVTWVAGGLVPLVLLGSACHVVIALHSASTKEAHTWMSSLMFVPMLAGLGLVFAPGVAGGWWPFAPLVGQQMWINRTLASHGVSIGQAIAVTLATLAACAGALGLARRAFDRDDLLAG